MGCHIKISVTNVEVLRLQALRVWLWLGILQSPCAVHSAYTHTPAWHSTVGQPRCYTTLELDATYAPVLFLSYKQTMVQYS